jgi:hypothetical protein
MANIEANKAVVQRLWNEVWNQHNLAVADSLYSTMSSGSDGRVTSTTKYAAMTPPLRCGFVGYAREPILTMKAEITKAPTLALPAIQLDNHADGCGRPHHSETVGYAPHAQNNESPKYDRFRDIMK